MARLHEIEASTTELQEVITYLERVLDGTEVPSQHDLSELNLLADSNCGMLHAAVRGSTKLQLLLGAERRKHQGVEQFPTGLQARPINHSTFICVAKVGLHSDVSR